MVLRSAMLASVMFQGVSKLFSPWPSTMAVALFRVSWQLKLRMARSAKMQLQSAYLSSFLISAAVIAPILDFSSAMCRWRFTTAFVNPGDAV